MIRIGTDLSYSEKVSDRLRRAMNLRRVTQRKLAELAGCHETLVHRILKGQDRVSINVLCRAFQALGYSPSEAFSEESSLDKVSFTGVEKLDETLIQIYSERSDTGVENLGKFITHDYLCCSNKLKPIRKHSDSHLIPVKTKEEDGYEMWGLSYKSERELSKANDMSIWIILKDIIIVDECRVTCQFVRLEVSEHKNKRSTNVQFAAIDQLLLDKTIKSIARGSPPRIKQKTWSQITNDYFINRWSTNKKGVLP